ncbi:MAG: NTP transferase domain-containing protein [Actinomycetota bacterium]|nr:NTP transferase domain-containing protein [Actinomycetota bacterium]
MSETSLLLLAGGLGSRFGGTKQLADVGPDGAAILDHSIREARAAGIENIVVIGRSDLDADLRGHLASQHPDFEPVVVHQDAYGPPRAKPWGTGHAVVSALSVVDGPVVILNADDHYGPTGIARVVVGLGARPHDGMARGAMLGFRLGRTLPVAGAVSRGICEVDADGQLVGLVETHGIHWTSGEDGASIWAADPAGPLSADVPVSMNIWGLPAESVAALEDQWLAFHAAHADSDTAEFLLPMALDEQRRDARLVVNVLETDEEWIGITSRDDLEAARAAFAAMGA